MTEKEITEKEMTENEKEQECCEEYEVHENLLEIVKQFLKIRRKYEKKSSD